MLKGIHIQKFITALIGAATLAIPLGADGYTAEDYLAIAIAFFTALGVYKVKNQ